MRIVREFPKVRRDRWHREVLYGAPVSGTSRGGKGTFESTVRLRAFFGTLRGSVREECEG